VFDLVVELALSGIINKTKATRLSTDRHRFSIIATSQLNDNFFIFIVVCKYCARLVGYDKQSISRDRADSVAGSYA
jgi:hypothetical protein